MLSGAIKEMSTETATPGETVRLGVSIRPFGRIVGAFAAMGLGLGVAAYLIGTSGYGQIARQMLGGLMLTIIPFVGVVGIAVLGISEIRGIGDGFTAALTGGAAALVGHLLVFVLAMPLVMLQPHDPPIPRLLVMELWVYGTLGAVLVGVVVGIVGTTVEP